MPKALHPPKWYEVYGTDCEEKSSAVEHMCKIPDQPAFNGKTDARKWLLGFKDEPGNAPSSGRFLLLRQLDEQDVVVQTVRTVVKAEALKNDVTPGTGDPLTDEEAEDAGDNPWESNDPKTADAGSLL